MPIKIKCKECNKKDAMVYYDKTPCCVKCYKKLNRGNYGSHTRL